MKKTIFNIAIIIFILILDLFVSPRVSIYSARPFFSLLFVLALAQGPGLSESLKYSIPLGIILDIFSATPFGAITLSLLTIQFALSLFSNSMARSDKNSRLKTFISIGLYYFIFLFFSKLLSMLPNAVHLLLWPRVSSVLFFNILYNFILSLIFFRTIQKHYPKNEYSKHNIS